MAHHKDHRQPKGAQYFGNEREFDVFDQYAIAPAHVSSDYRHLHHNGVQPSILSAMAFHRHGPHA